MSDFRLLMLGAMYENGGNTTHRFLDGHPQLYVYPFESQPGTRMVNDALTSMFPQKYRWPRFALDATPQADFHAIIDEEAKIRARTPFVSKFRDWPFDMDDDERRDIYVRMVGETGRSRANNVAAYYRSTFEAWKDHASSGREQVYVGYSPIIVVDAGLILADMPQAHVLHVVRNPWAAYADTKKRAVPLSLDHYMLGWTVNQQHALLHRERTPERLHIVRTEDVMRDSQATLAPVLRALGLEQDAPSLAAPSWNARELEQVYPWGTIRAPTPERNLETAQELTEEELQAIAWWAEPYLDLFGYREYLTTGTVTDTAVTAR